ncbi:MAG: hypothetical protein KC516_00465 [Nanoarchaeota archaeon]|nr:hypothetical protein [Nanoarchaeota archaeon]
MKKNLDVYVADPCKINIEGDLFEIGKPTRIDFDLDDNSVNFYYKNVSEEFLIKKFSPLSRYDVSAHFGIFEPFHSDGKTKYLSLRIPEDFLVSIKNY